MHNRILIALLLAVLVAACGPSGETLDSTEILWDEWGVPHIFATDDESMFYSLGWAQTRAHGDLLLELIGKARGRAAEYWGGNENLESDRWIRTMGAPARAAEDNWGFLAGKSAQEVEKNHIRVTLELTGGNRIKAATAMGISERTLYRKIREYEL